MDHYVEWKPYYSVGDATIDAEHRRLLEIIDKLFVAIQMGHTDTRVHDTIAALADYTATHFEHEERLMQECGYPAFDAHKALHDEMRRRVQDYRASENAVSETELLHFVKAWWVSHIQCQDKAYAPYLAAAHQPAEMA
jgi:hemerythrin